MFDLTSMQDATENCRYPELVGEPLRLELNFTVPLEHVAELIVLGERMSSVAADEFGVVGETSSKDNFSLQKLVNRLPLLRYRYRGFFLSDFVPTLDNDSFAIMNTQPSNMQGEHWIMIANSRQILFFAGSLGRIKSSFFKQQYEQMMPKPLTSRSSVCGFYTNFANFHLFKFLKEETTEFLMLMYFHS